MNTSHCPPDSNHCFSSSTRLPPSCKNIQDKIILQSSSPTLTPVPPYIPFASVSCNVSLAPVSNTSLTPANNTSSTPVSNTSLTPVPNTSLTPAANTYLTAATNNSLAPATNTSLPPVSRGVSLSPATSTHHPPLTRQLSFSLPSDSHEDVSQPLHLPSPSLPDYVAGESLSEKPLANNITDLVDMRSTEGLAEQGPSLPSPTISSQSSLQLLLPSSQPALVSQQLGEQAEFLYARFVPPIH